MITLHEFTTGEKIEISMDVVEKRGYIALNEGEYIFIGTYLTSRNTKPKLIIDFVIDQNNKPYYLMIDEKMMRNTINNELTIVTADRQQTWICKDKDYRSKARCCTLATIDE